ncbi:hypothetical protein [Nocardia sp. CA-135398]|uniref:hypothetical protein n=1 Tax=Nocardia sp. CA-135398 TaxID=3239977 RepID=UPI003D96DAC9
MSERSERTNNGAAAAVMPEPSASEVEAARERSERAEGAAAIAVMPEPSASEVEA